MEWIFVWRWRNSTNGGDKQPYRFNSHLIRLVARDLALAFLSSAYGM
jgi:hypothetical protein